MDRFHIAYPEYGKMEKIGIFIPAYNEELIIERNIGKIIGELKKLKINANIYVVDDGSTDKTQTILKKLESEIPNLKSIRFENGPSRRENLMQAMVKAKEPYVMYTDMDLATDIKNISLVISSLDQGKDIAIGSRYSSKSKVNRSLARLIISKLYNFFMRLYFGSKIKDHQCGFKGFRTAVLKKLVALAGYDKSKTRGWFLDAEILILAQKQGYTIKEFGVRWNEGKRSTFKIGYEIKMLPYVLFSFPLKLLSLRRKN